MRKLKEKEISKRDLLGLWDTHVLFTSLSTRDFSISYFLNSASSDLVVIIFSLIVKKKYK